MPGAAPDSRTARIRQLNDSFRQKLIGGRIVITPGILALPDATKRQLLRAILSFDAFDEDNDPHGEHDFISVEHDGLTVFAKIDYYATDMLHGSEDPSNPAKTIRVMTCMLSSEY